MTKMRLVVVDDHELFRGGIVGLLEERGIDVVGEASTGAEGIRLASELRPDVVLMDLSMPGMSGVEATQRLAVAAPTVKVLVLTVVTDHHDVIQALLAGACGYLLKDAPVDQVIGGIAAAARGESMIAPRVTSDLVRQIREPRAIRCTAPGVDLTSREAEVLEFVVRGMDNREIAGALYLSQHTVKNHVSSILLKLQVENRLQAAVRAVRARIA